MKNLKSLLALMLALVMVFALCACGDDKETTNNSHATKSNNSESKPESDGTKPNTPDAPDTPDTPDTPKDPEYVYTVKVQDTNGNPISGLNVQICAGDSCVPKKTDDTGVAGYDKPIEGNGELTAKIIKLPEGYVGVSELSMEGETEVVFILTNVSSYVYTVSVVDTEGNAIPGVNVQICAGDTCVPKKTDVNGIAGYDKAVEGNGERAAKLIVVPAGYTAVDNITEITMGNETQVTFVLEKAN